MRIVGETKSKPVMKKVVNVAKNGLGAFIAGRIATGGIGVVGGITAGIPALTTAVTTAGVIVA